jgi:KDO2-lipid IV(A) lauroyltransferase
MYYLLLAFLYPLSLLPLRVLYWLSDFACFVLFTVAGYRKKIVWDNLKHAFPEKSDEELRQIAHAFYRSFLDQWIETLKLLSISEKELNKRITGNWEVFHQLQLAGKNTYALLGHTFNWEWANVACQYNTKQQFAGVYMPLNNKAFDRLMQRIRTRSGAWLISMKGRKGFAKLSNVQYIVGLIADQNPSNWNSIVWLQFMNREAPFFKGPDLLARKAQAAVVFAGIKKLKRGYYHINLQLLEDNAAMLPDGEVITQYVQFMEQQIKDQPENWMWTHRRWKYKNDD